MRIALATAIAALSLAAGACTPAPPAAPVRGVIPPTCVTIPADPDSDPSTPNGEPWSIPMTKQEAIRCGAY